MAVNLSPVGGVAAQFFTNTGAVLTGGKIYTYAAGTTTPSTTYTSSQGTTAWTNPIVLDAAGRVSGGGEIWLTDGINYKFVLKDSNDVLIATYDNISGINSNFVSYTNQQEIVTATAGQTVFNLSINYQPGTNSLSVFVDGVNQYGPGAQYAYTETDSDTVTFVSGLHVGAQVKFTTTQQQGAGAVNALQVTYNPAGTGAVATNVQAKLRQYVSVKDFGAVGDGVTDDTAAMQAAHNTSQIIYYPPGTYKFTTLTNITAGGIVGAGQTQSILLSTDTTSADLITFTGASVGGPQNALTFQNFMLQGQAPTKTAGSGIKVAPATSDNIYAFASNVTISYVPVGFDFVRASFFKIIACNLLAYNVAGVQVANANSNDAGDSEIIGCAFSTPYNGGSLPAGIKQFSSGGLRVIGNKFLGGNYGYLMAYTDSDGAGTNTSNLIIANNSIENFYGNAIALTKISASLTAFVNVVITGNQIAVALATPSVFLIVTDSNTWLQNVTITGNVMQLPGTTNSYGIALTNVTCVNISGNTFRGNGGTSQAIGLTSCVDTKVGTNVYSNITIPYVAVTPGANNSVALDLQSGSATTASTGWSTYGTLYRSTLTSVTFTNQFLIAPNVWDVQLTAGDGSGTVAGIVGSVTTTGFSFYALNVFNTSASTIYWSVKGYI